MEASALTTASHGGLLARRSPLLRLQSDEGLVALIRDGHDRAFEVLFDRYQSRLLAFCRAPAGLGAGRRGRAAGGLRRRARGDARRRAADQRAAVALPDRPQPLPELPAAAGRRGPGLDGRPSARERRDDARAGAEPRGAAGRSSPTCTSSPRRSARRWSCCEIDDLSYTEIAQAMGTTLPAVKSLLVRARMSLAEASEARVLTCDEVRLELAEAAEGLSQGLRPGPPPRSRLRALPPLPARASLEHQGARRAGAVRPSRAAAEAVRREVRRRLGRHRLGGNRRGGCRGLGRRAPGPAAAAGGSSLGGAPRPEASPGSAARSAPRRRWGWPPPPCSPPARSA